MDSNSSDDLVAIVLDADINHGGGIAVVDGEFRRLVNHLYHDDGTWQSIYSHAINDLGWIAASGRLAGGFDELAIVLRPVGQCPAELTFDGKQNFFDIAAFLNLYAARDPLSDLAEPKGVFDFADCAEFLIAFEAGCPG